MKNVIIGILLGIIGLTMGYVYYSNDTTEIKEISYTGDYDFKLGATAVGSYGNATIRGLGYSYFSGIWSIRLLVNDVEQRLFLDEYLDITATEKLKFVGLDAEWDANPKGIKKSGNGTLYFKK